MEIIGTTQIYDSTPELQEEVDCMYCNPPAGISSLTAAMPGKYETYEEYMHEIFKYIWKVNPSTLYIEVGVTNKEIVKHIVEDTYDWVFVDICKGGYHKDRRKWIIRCSNRKPAPSPCFQGTGTSAYIRFLCMQEEFRNIVHMYMTDGWLEFQAYKNEKKVIAVTRPGDTKDPAERLRQQIEHHEETHKKA